MDDALTQGPLTRFQYEAPAQLMTVDGQAGGQLTDLHIGVITKI